MAQPGTVIGWLLDEDCRERLLDRFTPAYEKTVAHHVTLSSGATDQTPLPPEVRAEVVGLVDDQKGVEALVVTINGSTDRVDGSTYHVTWSLGPTRRARESNDVLRDLGWEAIEQPILISLRPARF
ncbi:hypothetical protein G7078_08825 [Sphingomonas sinipercae]|uniref:Uncharacterized protein n=1 Tax=Sphingomonas sinipercae TaxID=2714944 RepID=A0A6G7ZPF7_9SPHN|nr:hypothetical protein [Sphingomonas sinipercae]QIL02877.1 hypothetical protein G7078_08825 [Sphingomonas sinipercae]